MLRQLQLFQILLQLFYFLVSCLGGSLQSFECSLLRIHSFCGFLCGFLGNGSIFPFFLSLAVLILDFFLQAFNNPFLHRKVFIAFRNGLGGGACSRLPFGSLFLEKRDPLLACSNSLLGCLCLALGRGCAFFCKLVRYTSGIIRGGNLPPVLALGNGHLLELGGHGLQVAFQPLILCTHVRHKAHQFLQAFFLLLQRILENSTAILNHLHELLRVTLHTRIVLLRLLHEGSHLPPCVATGVHLRLCQLGGTVDGFLEGSVHLVQRAVVEHLHALVKHAHALDEFVLSLRQLIVASFFGLCLGTLAGDHLVGLTGLERLVDVVTHLVQLCAALLSFLSERLNGGIGSTGTGLEIYAYYVVSVCHNM